MHGLLKQVDAVRRELDSVHAAVQVQGALCFVGTELPWFGNSNIVDVPLLGPRGLAASRRSCVSTAIWRPPSERTSPSSLINASRQLLDARRHPRADVAPSLRRAACGYERASGSAALWRTASRTDG